MDEELESTRVDRWLWGVRLYKTRSLATTACQGGHVRVNGAPAKPATKVHVGDLVSTRIDHRDRVLQVVKIIEKRVGAPIAAECLIDRSPPPPDDEWAGPIFVRERGAGRPTKRDRRVLDSFTESHRAPDD